MLVNLILHPKPNSVQWCCLSHLRQSLPHEERRTYTFCAAASLDENTPECLSLFTLWDLRHLLKIKDTGVHQQMDVFMWFCAATMFKWDISLMLSLQLSRSVPRFYQTNEHSLKQTDSRASAWLGPPGGGGSSASSGVYQADRSAGTQFRLRSPDVTRSHAGLFCAAAAAAELRKSDCTEVLLSLKILLIYFCLIFPLDCKLVVGADSVIISL